MDRSRISLGDGGPGATLPRPKVAIPVAWLLLMAALVVLAAFMALTSYDDYEHTISREFQSLEIRTGSAEAQISSSLRGIDLLLQRVIDEGALPGLQPEALRQRNLNLLKQFPAVRALVRLNAAGRVISSDSFVDPEAALKILNFDATKSSYYLEHRDAGRADWDHYKISRPFKTVTGRFVVTVSRSIRGPDGRLLGVALVSLAPTYFEDVLNQVLPTEASGSAALVNKLGDVIFRVPDSARAVGTSVAGGVAFEQFLRSSGKLTRGINASAIDGATRLIVFSKVGDTTLGVSVTRGYDQVMARWRHAVILKLIGFTFLAVIGVGVAIVMNRRSIERELADRELEQSESRFRLAMDASTDGMWDWNVDSDTSYFSPAYEKMLGYRLGDFPMKSQKWLSQVHPDDVARIAGLTRDCIANVLDSVHTEFRIKVKDGSWKWVLARTRAVSRDANGIATRVVGTHSDITDRKKAEEDRATLAEQLHESQKLEAIGQLAGGIAHDFNNIVASILGNVAFVRQDLAANDPNQVFLDQATKAGLRARSLVKQILSFSKRQPVALSSVALRPVAEETLHMLQSVVPDGVKLSLAVPADPVIVMADVTQLQQVLLNLATNAWQALPDGVGHIEIGLEQVALMTNPAGRPAALAPGPYARLWVRDDGGGMDEQTRSRIFEPFFSTKAVSEGTGLGLAVVHGVVSAHGGAIVVQTALGAGTTFEVYLPIADAQPIAMPIEPVPVAAQGQGGQRVLYVDDDEFMARMVAVLLRRLGYQTTSVTDPQEAIDLVLRNPGQFDVVVTDYNMPGQTGVDVIRAIRRARPDMPCVISSGALTDDLLDGAGKLGGVGVMRKEYSLEEMGSCIQTAIVAVILPMAA